MNAARSFCFHEEEMDGERCSNHNVAVHVDAATGEVLPENERETLAFAGGTLLIVRSMSGRRLVRNTEAADVCGFGFHAESGGRLRFEGQRTLTIRAGDCLRGAAPRGAQSLFSPSSDGTQCLAVVFKPDEARAFCESRGVSTRRFGVPDNVDAVGVARSKPLSVWGRAILSNLLASPYDGAARRLHLESGAFALLAEQLTIGHDGERMRVSSRDRKRLEIARQMLEAHFQSPPSILELAREAGLNDFKLKRDFKREYGLSPHAFARELRLEAAARALSEGASVKQASAQAGYACTSRFSQAFRKRFGLLPREWR
jgi:AraC-like DNA-binding protein